MISRPKQSKFMGHVYKIVYRPSGTIKGEDGCELDGETDNQKTVISIEDGMVPSRERTVLIHEVIHQLFNSSSLDLPDDIEESVVTHLGLALGAHIQDNPLFWRYCTRRIPKDRT